MRYGFEQIFILNMECIQMVSFQVGSHMRPGFVRLCSASDLIFFKIMLFTVFQARALTHIVTVLYGLQKASVKRIIFICYRNVLRVVKCAQEGFVSDELYCLLLLFYIFLSVHSIMLVTDCFTFVRIFHSLCK